MFMTDIKIYYIIQKNKNQNYLQAHYHYIIKQICVIIVLNCQNKHFIKINEKVKKQLAILTFEYKAI